MLVPFWPRPSRNDLRLNDDRMLAGPLRHATARCVKSAIAARVVPGAGALAQAGGMGRVAAAWTLALALLVVPASADASPGDLAGPGAASRQWVWPVNPPRIVVRPYLAPATPYSAGHRGIDVETATTVVYAPADGVVRFAGYVVDRPVLSLQHSGEVLSSFEPVTTTLVAGDPVKRGDVIGTVEPGHCTVVLCLHVGVRLGGEYFSPLLYFGGLERSVLLPTRGIPGAPPIR